MARSPSIETTFVPEAPAGTAPLRVLHLVSSGGLYGAEHVILNLARSEDTVSFVGALLNVHRPNLDVINEARSRALRTAVFESRGRVDFGAVSRIRRFLKNNRIDILHTHGYKSDIVGSLATLRCRTRWVATNHLWHGLKGARLYEAADAIVLRWAGRIVAVSREIRKDMIAAGLPPAKIEVIDNGIDIERFSRPRSQTLRASFGISDEQIVVTIVGRLSPEKGHRTLLEAASRLSSSHDSVRFLIVGDGPIGDELRAEAARLNVNERVRFTGFREDMPEIYAVSDVLVNASTLEGLPMTILEAMASRVPVIATRAGAIPEVISDGETGLLVQAQDAAALEGALKKLIDDRATRCRLASNAFENVTLRYSSERMCRAYGRIYRDALDAR